jgi:uncharacterized membrane protein YgcG
MKIKISGLILGAAVMALTSCSVYKSGQTPDDVYYSPGKPTRAYAQGNRDQEYYEANPDRRNYNGRNDVYDDPYGYRDDRYLRMMIATGRYPMFYNDFSMVDPWMYNNWRWNSYMTWNSGLYSPYNSLWYWNSFYNPYYAPVYPYYPGKGYGYGGSGVVMNYPRPSRPVSAFSMSSYLNTRTSTTNSNVRPGRFYGNNNNNAIYYNNNRNNSIYNNSNSRSSYGGDNRSNNSSSFDRPTRSYSPSSSGGSSSSGGGGGVSRPTRTGHN